VPNPEIPNPDCHPEPNYSQLARRLAIVLPLTGFLAGCGLFEDESKPAPDPAITAAIQEYEASSGDARREVENRRVQNYVGSSAVLEASDGRRCMTVHVQLPDGRKVWLSADHCVEDGNNDQTVVEKPRPDRAQGLRLTQAALDAEGFVSDGPRQVLATISSSDQVQIRDDNLDLAVIKVDTPDKPVVLLNDEANIQDVMAQSNSFVSGYPDAFHGHRMLGMPLHYQAMGSTDKFAQFSYIAEGLYNDKMYLRINVHGYSGSGILDKKTNTVMAIMAGVEKLTQSDPRQTTTTTVSRAFFATRVSSQLVASYLPEVPAPTTTSR
jgi:hypothetical protein